MKTSTKEKLYSVLKYLWFAFCLITGIFTGALWFYHDSLPPTSELRNYTLRSGSEVYDRNGKMVYLFAFEKRKLVSLKELPQYLIDALIITEDKHFYHHFGIDILGNIRALAVDLVRMDFSQGASTITQQMARNMFLTLDKRLSRKLKEIILALRIEQEFTKDEILEIYFNKIFWGGQIHGVETASLYYFGKHARDLTLAEAAALVGMIQRPNYYNPTKHPERLIERRNMILGKMLKAKKITQEEYNAAVASKITGDRSSLQQYSTDYYIEHIRLYLERKYGTEKLFEGGLKIYTPMDVDLSVYADSVLNRYLSRVEKGYPASMRYDSVPKNSVDINTRYLQGGILLMENSNGQVLAMLGGRNFTHSKFNRITQAKRQPGSAIKPTYYTAAIEKGYTPATVINDAFRRFGIDAKAEDYSAALGAYEVTPINLISAFTTFPNNGFRTKPVFITKVEDINGKVLERSVTAKYDVTSPQVAFIMTSLLQSVVTSGTGAAAKNNYYWQAAGKTGTSSDHRDAWFIGFNRKYTLGIWNGFDNNAAISASASCAPIWGQIMTRAIRNENKGRFPKSDDPRYSFVVPDRIVKRTINPKTGFLSENGIEEYFIEDNIPPARSDTISYNYYPTRMDNSE